MIEAKIEDVYEVFEEKTVYPIMHVFLPALLYIYLRDSEEGIYKVLTIIYLYETFEYLLAIFLDSKWAEPVADSLVLDIVMAIVGILAAELVLQNKRIKTSWNNRLLHIVGLCITSFCIVTFLSSSNNDVVMSYAIYCGVYILLAFIYTGSEWAIFSTFCMFFIHMITTEVYQEEYTKSVWLVSPPYACLYVVAPSSIIYYNVERWMSRKDRRAFLLPRSSNYKVRV